MDEEVQQLGCFIGVVGIIILVVMAIIGGSFRTEVTYTFPEISNNPGSIQTTFEETLNARHWVFGLVKGEQPDLQEALSKYVRAGETIKELKVVIKHTWVDNLIAGVTLLIYCPQTVVVSGTVSKK